MFPRDPAGGLDVDQTYSFLVSRLSSPGPWAPALRHFCSCFILRDSSFRRTVVIEFESVEKAMAVHDSPGYQAALKALGDGAVRDLRTVAGVE